MDFTIVKPHRLLQQFIQYYWILEGADMHAHKIIPDGFPEMIFHYGDHYFFNNGSGNKKQSLNVAAGQLTKPIFIRPSGKSGVIGVKFSPAGMWSLFNCDLSLLTNDECSLEDLDVDVSAVTHAFERAKNTSDRISALENFFLRRLNAVKTFSGREALQRIVTNKGDVSISALCVDLKISDRKLQRIFKEAIGVSAKTYQRLMRFTLAYSLLQQSHVSKSDIAFLCGYFDQSHFNLDFRSFTNEDPSSYFTGSTFLSDQFRKH